MRRRTLVAGGLMGALAIGGGAGFPSVALAAGEDDDVPTGLRVHSSEDLGVAISTVRVTSSTFGHWTDGRPVVYTAGGQPETPMEFTVLDAVTGEKLDAHTVPDTYRGNSLLLAPDGNVYIASWGPHAYLLRYSPESREVTNLGFGIPDDVVITALIAGDDDLIYGGGYPSGRAFSYNTSTEEFVDLGVAVEGEQYAYSLAHAPGRLFIGTEPHARLVSIDLSTGAKTMIDNPEWAAGSTRHYHLRYREGLLFSYTSPSLDWHVYDTETEEWIDRIEYNGQGGMTEVDENGDVYFGKLTDGLYRYNVRERTGEAVGWPLASSESSSGTMLLDLKDPAWPGETVVGMGSRGVMWLWNPATGTGERRTLDVPEFPMTIRSLGLGPDGNMYIGGGTSAVTFAGFDTTTDEFINYDRGPAARVDAVTAMNDKVYFTTYGQGILFEYDLTRDYSYGSNPRQAFQLYADYHQERIYALEAIDEHVLALGTIGGRGVASGQLFLYDDRTQVKTDLGVPLQGHAVSALTSLGDYLIGGTTVDVLGGETPETEAKVFLWDLFAGETVWDGVPEAGAKDISELTVDDDGTVWGLTSSGSVFSLDLASREFGDVVSVGAAGGMWGHGSLEVGPDGRLYGSTAIGEVFVLDPRTLAVGKLDEGEYATFDGEGRLYFARDGALHRITFTEAPPEPTIEGLRSSVAQYVEDGAVSGPIAHQLPNALDQAERHVDAGRTRQAVDALDRFLDHLGNPKRSDTLTEEAAGDLEEQAEALKVAVS